MELISEKDMEVDAPNEPWENLAYMMEKFWLIEKGAPENCRKFLSAGEEIELPMVFDTDGGKTPYRLYPNACYSVINSCVKVLEKSLENQINGGVTDAEEEKVLIGTMTLADILFSGACTSPDGKFTIHWVRKDKEEITLNPHGRRVKQLVTRLEKYRIARVELARTANQEVKLPVLTCRTVVEQEMRVSLTQWKAIDPKAWDGRKPWEITDSLDSMRENMGYEAQSQISGGGMGDDFEDKAEIHDQIVNQNDWLQLPSDSISSTVRYSDKQRGNTLARTPKAWLWNYAEDPLGFAVDYVATNTKSCLEEAHQLLSKASEDSRFAEAGSLALILDADSKNNPDNFWKIIKRIAGHFPSSRRSDPEALLQKLDCARFTVCLHATNTNQGIDSDEFLRNFKEKIHQVLGDPKRRESVTRNELLMETLGECQASSGWNQQQKEQWLEHLQSSAVGAYENSLGMEAERKRLLGKLNHLFETPRAELERTRNSPQERDAIAQKLHKILESTSQAFYTYLSGKTGQMTRRELRTKVHALKGFAERSGKAELAARLTETSRFISSISSQIKMGEWYEKKTENTARIFGFLTTMLECPKQGPLEFPGSAEPEPKDPVEITCDFLRAMQGKNTLMGRKTLSDSLKACKEYEMADEGGRLTLALKKITKTRDRGRGEAQTLSGMIKDRKDTLEQAILIAETIYAAGDPVRALHNWIKQEVEILRQPQDLETESNREFKKNLHFWKGLHYLAQNIQSRKEDEHFQVSATGKGTLQNIIAMAKAKLRNKEIKRKDGENLSQFTLTRTRERTLVTNLAVPIGLWLGKEVKGKKTQLSQEEFVDSLKGRLHACEVCLDISQSDSEIEQKTAEFEQKHKRAKNLTNSYVLAEIIGTLDDVEELKAGIEWEMTHGKESALLEEKYPDLDTPNKKWNYLETERSAKKESSMQIAEI